MKQPNAREHFVVSRKWNNPQIGIRYDAEGITVTLDAAELIVALARSLDDDTLRKALSQTALVREALERGVPHPMKLWTKKQFEAAIAKALTNMTVRHESMESILLEHFSKVVEEMKAATIHQPPPR